MPSASCTQHRPVAPSASVGLLKTRACTPHNGHHANVRLTYRISYELRIFSRTFCFDPFTFEVGVDALSSSYKEHSDVSQVQKPGLWASQG